MKKIIILNYGLHISGVSRTLVTLANSLVEHGYDVTIKLEINDFTLQDELDSRVKCSLFLKEPHIFGFRIKGFLRFYSWYMKKLLKLPKQIQYHLVVRKKYDVEIAYNRGAAANIISGSSNKKARKLVWVHNDYMRNDNPLAGFKDLEDAQNGYSKFDKIVCVSEQSMRAFSEKFGTGYPLITCYNIMDVNKIKFSASSENVKKRRFTIVAIGRLCEGKNYTLLMDTVEILNEKGYVFDCWIIGGGNLERELIEYRDEKGLMNVSFLGAKKNPFSYMKTADCFVSSSIYEGLSTTTIEALILGLPCVVTDCTGMKNILGEYNDYGMVVPIDKNALAESIEKMIVDEELRNHYKEKARERAVYFNPESSFSKIEKLL